MGVYRRLFGVDAGGVERAVRTDSAGRIKHSNAQPDTVIGTLSAIAETVELDMDGFSSFTVALGVGSTYAGVTVVLEQTFDGTNWAPLNAVRVDNAAAAAATTIIANAASAVLVWGGAAPGAVKVRVRMTGRTSGSVSVRFVASSAAGVPVVQTHAVTGSLTTVPATPTTTNYELAATTNSTLVVGAASTLWEFSVFNPTAATVYLKFYNKATAPTVGTDAPILTIAVPTNETRSLGFNPLGKRFATGMGFAVTAGPTKADTVVVAAGVQLSLSRT